MSKTNSADLGFEQEIWKAADILRGNMDASEYKHVVLGLIFLKYISDAFEQRHQELIEEGKNYEEDRDEYTFLNIFYARKRWGRIAASAHTRRSALLLIGPCRLLNKKTPDSKGSTKSSGVGTGQASAG